MMRGGGVGGGQASDGADRRQEDSQRGRRADGSKLKRQHLPGERQHRQEAAELAAATAAAPPTQHPPKHPANDRARTLEQQIFESHKPLFMHIPKTAGTSIENAINRQKLTVGTTGGAACQWHTPPQVFIRGSFAVVRPVLDRVVSEFCWMRTKDIFGVYKAKYNCREVWPYTCDMLNDWLAAALEEYKIRPDFPGCHMVPQWCYASKAERLILMRGQVEEAIRKMHPRTANMSLKHENYDAHGQDKGPCARFNITTACINSTNIAGVREHFQEDFEHIDPLFTDEFVGSAAHKDLLWETPGRYRVGPVQKERTMCRAPGTKTLYSRTPCAGEPWAPNAKRSTCIASLDECVQLAWQESRCSSVINYHDTSDNSAFPGWCKCMVRGSVCQERLQAGSTLTSFAKVAPPKKCPDLLY